VTPEGDDVAALYADDPRVTWDQTGTSATVALTPERTVRLLHTKVFGWALHEGPNLDFVQLDHGGLSNAGFAAGFDKAGDLLRAVLGEPVTAGA
jgi:hypothetical protein